MIPNLYPKSDLAMAAILALHFPGQSVLDVTYGQGTFYRQHSGPVIGCDLRPCATVRADWRALPFAARSFDIVVADPPYKRGPTDTRYRERYGRAPYTAQRTVAQYAALLSEALRCARGGLILKVQDTTDGHIFYSSHMLVAETVRSATGLRPHDIAYIGRPRGSQPIGHGVQHFMANRVSIFLIFKWVPGTKYRPYRY